MDLLGTWGKRTQDWLGGAKRSLLGEDLPPEAKRAATVGTMGPSMASQMQGLDTAQRAALASGGVPALMRDPAVATQATDLAGQLDLLGPIKAYHGTPHTFLPEPEHPLGRFRMDKLGTGEGAQAYGHGLYFAENPATAKSYRDTLAPSRGKLPDDIISLPPEMRQAIMSHAGTDADAVTAAKRAQYMSSALREVDLPKVTDMVERARVAKQGRMYEVNINAAPEHFLDWDKALAQQSPAVRSALEPYANIRGPQIDPETWVTRHGGPITGGQFYESSRLVPGEYRNQSAASEALREAGIPGIKYLDQGSRPLSFDPQRIADLTAAANKYRALGDTAKAAEYEKIIAGYPKPTSNYVLFRDDIIDIVKKYGLAGAAAMYGISQDEAKAAMDNPKDKKMSIGRQTYGDEE